MNAVEVEFCCIFFLFSWISGNGNAFSCIALNEYIWFEVTTTRTHIFHVGPFHFRSQLVCYAQQKSVNTVLIYCRSIHIFVMCLRLNRCNRLFLVYVCSSYISCNFLVCSRIYMEIVLKWFWSIVLCCACDFVVPVLAYFTPIKCSSVKKMCISIINFNKNT